jgi:SAM-dependent methyltransferase
MITYESMERYFEANKRRWNELVEIHTKGGGYDVEGFLKGKNTLHSIELEALRDIKGKTLLHLQCYFGLDTLSWARLGAKVTGVDFSNKAIELARILNEKTKLDAEFINCNIYNLPKQLDKQYDIVYTSYGVLNWLNDIEEWARIAARYLKSGGTFFIAEFHPFPWIFDFDHPSKLVIKYNYWHKAEPDSYDSPDAYASGGLKLKNTEEYGWAHPIGTVVSALINAGLTIQWLREYPFSVDQDQFKFMTKDPEGYWRLPGDPVPLMYSIKATKS